MDVLDQLLVKYGLKYEDLNNVERETLDSWMGALRQNQVTIEKIREYLTAMRDSLLLEVSDYKTGSVQDCLVKARIRNYTLLLAFLSTPEKAKEALERAIAGVA